MGLEYQSSTTEHKEQNVVFSDQMSAYKTTVDSVVDVTRTQQDTYDAELADFFARPIKIAEYEWNVGSGLFQQFNPWSLYLENSRVSNRIANFNLLRCKLHLKFVINANGFMYSRILTSYLPFHNWDALTESSALFPNDAVQESQMPHIFLNPTTSTGGEMVLPFVWHRNNIYIPTSEWDNMGRITLRSLATLKHANGATGVATITVFAWAEEMSLNVLTSVDPSTMSPQSGDEIEEANKQGMISGPATAVSRMADALAVIPQIQPFATATSMVAKGVASAAKALGYSRPPQTRDNYPVKPVPVSSLALTTVPDTVQKLTIDDKQELTIDPRIAGLSGDDPMSIKEIASKESYLTQFDWSVGTAPGTLLWNGRVDPCTFAYDGVSKIHMPATCVAALPFKYWTGTMKFRFQIMSSAYHKGRLKISYDPNWVNAEEFNTMYTRVVDIASETDFTISVSNGQDVTLLDHHIPGVDSITQLYSTTRYVAKEEGNGVLAVSILNELTTPNSTVNNDITINVYVSMGDDFEVYVPTENFAYYVYKPQSGEEIVMSPQSGEEVVPDAFTQDQDQPEHTTSVSIGPTISNLDEVSLVFTGESVKTFRQLLKRYNLHRSFGVVFTGDRLIYQNTAYFPYLRGNVANAINTTALAASYNYCNTILLHWIVNCFSGWRGSLRTKIIPQGYYKTDDRLMTIHVERDLIDSGAYNQYRSTMVTAPAYGSSSIAAEDAVVGTSGLHKTFGARGQMYCIDRINPTAEFEIPFYSNNRFIPGKIEDYTGPRGFSSHEMSGIDYYIWVNGNNTTTFDFRYAIGEDFNVYFWTGCPPVYYEANPPVA